MLKFTGERIVPGVDDCEPTFSQKMYQEHLARYVFASQLCADAKVLDVGCGVGYGSRYLADSGAHSVLAIDISSDAIDHARSNFADPKIEFQVASATSFETDDRFDLVTCFEIIEHVADQAAVFKTIQAHLKPDGYVVMSTPRPLAKKRSDFHERELSFYDFQSALRRYFTNVLIFQENNYFTSIIHAEFPELIQNIKSITDNKGLNAADYFVAVASNNDPGLFPQMQPVLTLNDDSYVLLLEHDCRVLREAEVGFVHEQEVLRQMIERASAEASRAQSAETALRSEFDKAQTGILDSLFSINRLERSLEEANARAADRERLERSLEEANARAADLEVHLAAELIERREREETESPSNRESVARANDLEVAQQRIAKLEASFAYAKRESLGLVIRLLQGRGERLKKTKNVISAKLLAPQPATGFFTGRKIKRHQRSHRLMLASSHIWSPDQYQESDDIHNTAQDVLAHYLSQGWRELRQPHALFDSGWYLAEHSDVFAAGQEPLTHYIRYGAREGRQPSVGFDGAWYLKAYPDVARSGLNPLAHYILHGATEGRWPHPLFDPLWYSSAHSVPQTAPWSALAHYIAKGATEGLRPNHLFDPIWYLRTNPDVARADIDPLWHYLHHGWREGRAPSREFDGSRYLHRNPDLLRQKVNPLVHHLHFGTGEPTTHEMPALTQRSRRDFAEDTGLSQIVYVGHEPDNLSHSYRVRHPVEVLCGLGIDATWIREREVPGQLDLLAAAEIVVFARMAWVPAIEHAITRCRAAGVKIVFDIDDYVFDPAIANTKYVDGLRSISRDELTGYYQGVALYNRMVLESDVILASTETLVRAAEGFGKVAYLLPNGSSPNVIGASREAWARKALALRGESVIIGYASGTKTHQRDFSTVAGALLRLFRKYKTVTLRVIGHLELGEFSALKQFHDRIEQRGLVDLDQLPFEYAGFDVNIAPLEIGNPYCEAKSALKFIEAGLVGVPTVASATETYRAAITDGKTGFLAESEEEWFDKLEVLVTNRDFREEMGRRALEECDGDLPARHRRAVQDIFSQLLAKPSRKIAPSASATADPRKDITAPKHRLRIGWIVPGLLVGGGGHRNILRAAHFLQIFGHNVALYFTDTKETAATLRELVRQHFYPFEGEVHVYDGTSRGDDVLFATHWSTVGPAEGMKPQAGEIIYFVQDFEPSFAAMSSEYVLAENTYRKGLYAITSGRWCETVLRRDYGMQADHFKFPIDRTIYYVRPDLPRLDRIVFFAKPEMPRRCFELGLQTLRLIHNRRPNTEIVFFGSSNARGRVDFPVTFMDVLPGIADLAELYASARLGLAFSTTNPSLVPYEMMACGLPVVDLGRERNEVNYADRADIAFLANPEPEIMAGEIEMLLDDEEALARRSRNGVDFVASFPTELEMARAVERLIIERVDNSQASGRVAAAQGDRLKDLTRSE